MKRALLFLSVAVAACTGTVADQATSSPTLRSSVAATEGSAPDRSLPSAEGGYETDQFSLPTDATTTTTHAPTTSASPPMVDLPDVIPADILFETDSAELRPEAHKVLSDLATQLLARPDVMPVCFVGHTDSRASDTYNQQLSEERALAVYTWFLTIEGNPFQASDLCHHGMGERHLKVADNNKDGDFMPEAGALNRRVEIETTDPP